MNIRCLQKKSAMLYNVWERKERDLKGKIYIYTQYIYIYIGILKGKCVQCPRAPPVILGYFIIAQRDTLYCVQGAPQMVAEGRQGGQRALKSLSSFGSVLHLSL